MNSANGCNLCRCELLLVLRDDCYTLRKVEHVFADD